MATSTTLVVLSVVAHEGRYLIVEERDGTFYFPAGRVEPGENLMAAAVRETIEEAGILIGLHGIVGLEQQWIPGATPHQRLRFFFSGYAGVLMPPKSEADEHSRGACWLTRREIARLPLRHGEVLTWIDRVAGGAPVMPCAAYEWSGPT